MYFSPGNESHTMCVLNHNRATQHMPESRQHFAKVPTHLSGQRLDQVAAQLFSEFSRARLQQWIKSGDLTVDGQPASPRHKLLGAEALALTMTVEPRQEQASTAIDIPIVAEDPHFWVIDKPAGLTVHPGAGTSGATLMNGLLHLDPAQAELPRAGIVHRLDKDTTGLMVVARSLQAHTALVRDLQQREMKREYEAVCLGVLTGGGTITAPIGRHPTQRIRMAVRPGGRNATTHYRVLKRFQHHTHLRLQLDTGRTHQIRVHMAHLKHPLVGDPLYGGRQRLPAGVSEAVREVLQHFPRQALHAAELSFPHPITREWGAWQSPLPEDFQALLSALEQNHG